MSTTPQNNLLSFSDLPLGARFRYPGSSRVWTLIGKHRENEGGPMSGTIAEWQPDMLKKGLWAGQSICYHLGGAPGCPDLVEGID